MGMRGVKTEGQKNDVRIKWLEQRRLSAENGSKTNTKGGKPDEMKVRMETTYERRGRWGKLSDPTNRNESSHSGIG